MEYFKNEGRLEFLEFFWGFELKRRMFNKDLMKRVVLKIFLVLVDILLEKSGEEFEEKFKILEWNKVLLFSGDKLNIDNFLFVFFFESLMNDIIFYIEDIFNVDICCDLVGVVMVGGFLESMFVNFVIKKVFLGKKFIILMEVGLVVVKGVVFFGYDFDIIFFWICWYIYGC